MKCPNCGKEVQDLVLSWEWYSEGYKARCPECGKWIVRQRVVTNPHRDRPKHMSKKERLRLRREAACSKQ